MTIGELVDAAARRLAAAGVEAPLREARLLLGHAARLAMTVLMGWPEREVDPAAMQQFEALLGRRLAREPIARILGGREFWSLDFRVTPDTLDPRADTETLVDSVLRRIPDRAAPLRLLDLGTGTGCILLALLSELPAARGIGVDRSEAAARVARSNADRLGLAERARFLVGDWAEAIASDSIDILVSNPPYIPSDEIASLEPEVRAHDPRLALDGGADGLSAYRALWPQARRLLRIDGLAGFEVGMGQAASVADLAMPTGFEWVETVADLAGIERVVVARRERRSQDAK